jgi:putative transposase
MTGKREKTEDIVLKLRQVEVLHGQGKSVREAVRQISVTVQTFYRGESCMAVWDALSRSG